MKITTANRSKIVQSTGFWAYDTCANPYVGCQFGCTYCYVRFFVKDKKEPWGNFVRTRDHIGDLFKGHLKSAAGKRLVSGTMCDPYQPIERKKRLTRKMLEILETEKNGPSEIGLFTRSPIALDDIKLFKKLDVRIHVTITPFSREVLELIEPIAIQTEARFKMVEKLVAEDIKTHISVSPVIPIFSDPYISEFADRIAKIGPKGFTVDPMQAYGESFDATAKALQGVKGWTKAADIIQDNKKYKEWKEKHHKAWKDAWKPYNNLKILPISMDHQQKTRTDLRTNKPLILSYQ